MLRRCKGCRSIDWLGCKLRVVSWVRGGLLRYARNDGARAGAWAWAWGGLRGDGLPWLLCRLAMTVFCAGEFAGEGFLEDGLFQIN